MSTERGDIDPNKRAYWVGLLAEIDRASKAQLHRRPNQPTKVAVDDEPTAQDSEL